MPVESLLLHSDRRDQALGLRRPGGRTLSLLDYHRKQQEHLVAGLAQAAFYKALIDECRAQVTHLIDGADTPEKRRAVLPEAEQLSKLAEEAAQQLEALSHG